jgi:hypothetical protein
VNATTQCKNCGAAITGKYCAACGQHSDISIPSLHKLFVEALGDLYNFDSRLWRSFGLLLFKPGRLTREYLEGRRARYVPPFRLYVVLSLVFFFLLAVLPDLNGNEPPSALARGADSDPPDASENDPLPDAIESDAVVVDPNADPDIEAESERATPRRFSITTDESNGGGWNCDLGDTDGWNPEVVARFQRACDQISADAPSFGRALLDRVPVMMFLFIPIVAVGMKVLYPLARRKYVEHLLFFLHFHAFFFLLATLGLLVLFVGGLTPVLDIPVGILSVAGWVYVPIYLFLAMRWVYAQGRLATAFKYVLLGGGYFFALLFTFVGVVIYTALTL